MQQPKVLYISDSLGTPIHPRGIFNYSVSFIEILRQLGFHVTLVVEKVAGYGVPQATATEFGKYSADALGSAQLAEVYRYFHERLFHFNWRYKTKLFRTLVEKAPALARLIQRILVSMEPALVVDNNMGRLDFVPSKGEHLSKMDAFRLIRYFYSSSMSRAVNGLEPFPIDAKGYDLVVVDTPHFVKVNGIAPGRILTVVHDLIPLRDPTMGAEWRRLFIKKMEATLNLEGHLIFVSEYTRNMFHYHFPTRMLRGESVIYPPIRSSLMAAAAAQAVSPGYMRKLYVRKAKAARAAMAEQVEFDDGEQRLAVWSPSQPYFVTAVSDEPRKNIRLLIEAFAHLRDKANMVIIGQIDAARYVADAPESHANVHFTGFISESEKVDIIRGAAGMIFPSFSEGFGIPIVEGAILGVPVLCSDIAVFREIAADFGNYFDPHSPESLVAAVETALSTPEPMRARAAALRDSVVARFSQSAMAKRLAVTVAATQGT